MATGTSLSHVFPLDSALSERGVVEIGGCDALELAREFGTPAYVVAEADLRMRARAFLAAGQAPGAVGGAVEAAGGAVEAAGGAVEAAGGAVEAAGGAAEAAGGAAEAAGGAAEAAGRAAGSSGVEVAIVYASKACPCSAVLRVFAEEGLWCDVASGGELHLALAAGFKPERLVLHGNAKSESELRMALQHRVGLIVIDSFDELARLERLLAEGARDGAQPVLLRATPDVRGDTHDAISTGQADSKFGFGLAAAREAVARVADIPGLDLQGIHAHVGSQLLDLAPFERAAAQLATLGSFPVWDLGGGLGVAYTRDQHPPEIEDYMASVVGAARAHLGPHERLLVEPGRSLTARAGVTLYTVESVKHNVSTWVAVDGGMSDNLRPMLYDAVYEAHVVDRPDGDVECVLAGKHCESGDVLVRHARLADPRPGDIVVTPATGAYGYAMSNSYNGVPRAPVVFCEGGRARLVVRRESFSDLMARDVR
jgi:diaminopimelate decarboxylase